MNFYLGGFVGTDGGWTFITPYRIYLKVPEVTVPSKIFVFLDMPANGLNWGDFETRMDGYPNAPSQYQFVDFPGFYHEQGCTFSFVDGRVEVKRWFDPRTTAYSLVELAPGPPIYTSPANPDVAWLQDHATRPK